MTARAVAAVGVDVGATSTRAAAFDGASEVVGRVRVPTPAGVGAMLAAVAGVVESVDPGGAAPVAVGIPGRVDPDAGTVRSALNLGIVEATPVAAELAALSGRIVHLENDVNAGALGAAHLLGIGLTPASGLAYLSIGTGLAAGLVIAGRIHRGATGVAGEVGHLPVRADGPPCACGQVGCAEALASGAAVAARWGRGGVAALWAAAGAGDGAAVAIRDDLVGAICATVRTVVLTVDVDVVVLGGGVSQLGSPLLDAVRRRLGEEAMRSPLLTELHLGDRVRGLPPDVAVGELGAVLAAEQASRAAVTVLP